MINYSISFAIGRPDYTWFTHTVNLEQDMVDDSLANDRAMQRVYNLYHDTAVSFITQIYLESRPKED